MIWYQAAYDPEAPRGAQWVVLEMRTQLGGNVMGREVNRWPTKQEAHDDAKTNWEQLA